VGATPGLSFGMVVRDGAATLAECLASVAGVADELIVVDTGSHDETIDIAKQYGARVVAVPWHDDFAAARNRYLELARLPWILSLDADERLPNPDIDAIRATIRAHPGTAFGVTVRNFFHHDVEWPRLLPPSEFGGRASGTQSWHLSRTVRLLPNMPGLTYRFPVHESLIPAATRLRVGLRLSDLVVHHREHSAPGGARSPAKATQYRALGLDKLNRYPRYFRGHLEMARVYFDGGEWLLAETHLRECLRLSPMAMPANYFLGEILLHTGRRRELRTLLARAPMRGIDRCYLGARQQMIAGRPERAAALLGSVLSKKPGFEPARAALAAARAQAPKRIRRRQSLFAQ
jgi:hypothetical protein